MKSVYLIGSLRSTVVPELAATIRSWGFDVFDDWHAASADADDAWRDYEKARGHNYREALAGYAAKHIFEFDYSHLVRCDIGVMVMPAGKSGHLEAGWMAGWNAAIKALSSHGSKRTYALFDGEPERFDVMYQLLDGICLSVDELKAVLLRPHLEEALKVVLDLAMR